MFVGRLGCLGGLFHLVLSLLVGIMLMLLVIVLFMLMCLLVFGVVFVVSVIVLIVLCRLGMISVRMVVMAMVFQMFCIDPLLSARMCEVGNCRCGRENSRLHGSGALPSPEHWGEEGRSHHLLSGQRPEDAPRASTVRRVGGVRAAATLRAHKGALLS